MDKSVLILIFFALLVLLFGFGRLIGFITGLDKYFEDNDQKKRSGHKVAGSKA